MKTILKDAIYKIIKLFYYNRNKAVHLREIARNVGLNESSVSRHLNSMLKDGVLGFESEANLKKFRLKKNIIPEIFPFYDYERVGKFPILRRNAIKDYVKHLQKKPLFLILFGSTAKGTYRKDSDVDILEVVYSRTDNKKTISYVESQTGIRISVFQLTVKDFERELVGKKDKVVQSALNTGFPIFNEKYYYEEVYNE